MESFVAEIGVQKYEAYKESGVEWLGQVPLHWNVTRLGAKFKERRAKVSDKDYAPLSVTKNGILPQLDSAAKSNDGDNRKLVLAGDFVINSRSDRKGSSGISYLDGSVSLINIVIKPSGIEPAFCNYLLKSNSFIEEYYRMGHGIVADLWTTRYDEMKSILIGFPPLEEQTAIANFLDRKTAQIDQAISQKERLIELLQERRQILIQRAVTRGLNTNVPMNDSGVEWIGEVPAHWGIAALGYLANISTGSTPDRSRPNYWGGNIPWVKTGEINYTEITNTEEYISEQGLRNSATRIAPVGTILMAMYGQGVTRGRVGILGIPATYNQACCAIQLGSKLKTLFGYFFFLAAYPHIRDDGNESSQMNLSSGYISKLKLPIPPLSEQEEIIDFVNNVVALIDVNVNHKKKEIFKLKEYKSTLINAAVTGKIKVC